MRNINYLPRFTQNLVRLGLFGSRPLGVVDVGARSGPQSHWRIYGEQACVTGFEPDAEESARLNAQSRAGGFGVPFTCHPVALGRASGTARLYEYANKAGNSLTPPPGAVADDSPYQDIVIRRFDEVAAELAIGGVDFFKIDVEHHEVEVIEGLGRFVEEGGILGFEIEVHFRPMGGAPLLSDTELALRRWGYCLYDLDMFRASSSLLPSPVAWDHRNHNNEPIFGPTVTGRLVHGDALFFRTPEAEAARSPREGDGLRALKFASLLEVYGLPDCAAEVLAAHREVLRPMVDVDAVIDSLVPDHYGPGLSQREYLEAYYRNVGRVPARGGT